MDLNEFHAKLRDCLELHGDLNKREDSLREMEILERRSDIATNEYELLLYDCVRAYGECVDDLEGINNFAQEIKEECSKRPVESKREPNKWLSNLGNLSVDELYVRFEMDRTKKVENGIRCRPSKFNKNEATHLMGRALDLMFQTDGNEGGEPPSGPRCNLSDIKRSGKISDYFKQFEYREESNDTTSNRVMKRRNEEISIIGETRGSKRHSSRLDEKGNSNFCLNKKGEDENDGKKDKKEKVKGRFKNLPKFETEFVTATGKLIETKSTDQQRSSINRPFTAPFKRNNESKDGDVFQSYPQLAPFENDPRLQSIEKNLMERIMSEVRDNRSAVEWDDIAGLSFAREKVNEIIILPLERPDLFTGLLAPSRGLLLFGPPGTGKTLIGKCIASQCGSTFFSITASSLTSKWIGEGEKMVRALFSIARCLQPSVIFIDEIDSLLTQRNDTDHESSRRLKTEFLAQFDGLVSVNEEKLLVIGATNCPELIDEAARRRFSQRLYIGLPNLSARKQLMDIKLREMNHHLTEENIEEVSRLSEGYSGFDITNLCKEALMIPMRRNYSNLRNLSAAPPAELADFKAAFRSVKATVSPDRVQIYEQWNKQYGIQLQESDEGIN